jgi:16S rRNA (guanine966-N2)-methyltransferase
VRVVAGRLGGRRLEVPRGRAVRPTSDRVREALFSILGPVEGLEVLDLYAGSGALGIEALSRGAASATFVDSGAAAVGAIRRNLGALGLEGRVERRDALAFLAAAAGEGVQWDLAFADPPYSSAGRVAGPLAERLPPVLKEGARIVTESDKRNPLVLALPLADERVYGDTRVAIHRGP